MKNIVAVFIVAVVLLLEVACSMPKSSIHFDSSEWHDEQARRFNDFEPGRK